MVDITVLATTLKVEHVRPVDSPLWMLLCRTPGKDWWPITRFLIRPIDYYPGTLASGCIEVLLLL